MRVRLRFDHDNVRAGSLGEVVTFSKESGDGIVFHVLFYGHPRMYLLNPEDVEAL